MRESWLSLTALLATDHTDSPGLAEARRTLATTLDSTTAPARVPTPQKRGIPTIGRLQLCVVVIRIELDSESSRGAEAEAVYAELYGPLVGLAILLTGSRATAEEVAQDAFTAALGRWASIRDRALPEAGSNQPGPLPRAARHPFPATAAPSRTADGRNRT